MPVSTCLLCTCAQAHVLPAATLAVAADTLRRQGLVVREVPDLCRLAAVGAASLRDVAAAAQPVILACQPRAVRWLFHRAGAPLPEHAAIINLRTVVPADLGSQLAALGTPEPLSDASRPAPPQPASVPETDDWLPWYPVIDYARCNHCKLCLNFCLFGVYGEDAAGTVAVRHPQACKNNCPACARICPEVAIMFPKYSQGPIAGAEVTDEAGERDRVRVDVEKILGDDVYAALARRRQNRRRLFKSEG